MCIFIFLVFILFSNHPFKVNSELEYVQHFITITKIEEVTAALVKQWQDKSSRVCRFKDADRLKICNLALEESILRRHKYRLVHTDTLGPETVYRVQYGGPLSSNNVEETVTACKCPTWPPIYLQDGQDEDEIIILIMVLQRPPEATTYSVSKSSIFMG